NQEAIIINANKTDYMKKIKIGKIFEFEGLDRVEVEESTVGSIIAVTGVEGINIGDTICHIDYPEPLPFVKISEPTIAMNFSVNDSPFAGKEGRYLTSRQIRNRLFKELQTDVSLRVEETDSTDVFRVSGRGELHLSVLIENMRREGYEFQVSKPEVLYKYEGGKKLEPMERVTIDVSEAYIGSVIEKLGRRKGELIKMTEAKGGYSRLIFSIPARGLIGYRGEFMTDTKGEGILNAVFDGYAPYKGDIPHRVEGSLISFETGEATAYGLYSAQDRGTLFITPGTQVYKGMIIGSNPKGMDIEVNVCRKKHQSNIRASGSDEALRLSPPKDMSLEEALEFIEEDELIEVTPSIFRIRKKILDSNKRYKSKKN
ncbi:MAG: translational GTPase TypA, partial [Tissierellia bacterium]|nr:translational GTPase TypA [Tissierellia bacterium]